MYVIGTCVPDFPSSFLIRCRVRNEANHRYQSPLFDQPLDVIFVTVQTPSDQSVAPEK